MSDVRPGFDSEESIEVVRARADQLWLNQKWLMSRMDAIHMALCPKKIGSWQERAEQAVAAAEEVARKREKGLK